jgi:heat shock protein HslJ
MRRGVLSAVPVVLLPLLAACGSGDSTGGGSTSIEGTSWVLDAGSLGVDVPADVEVTASFSEDGKVSGNAGCNTYTGAFTVGEGNAISLGPLATTRMACVPEVSAVETAYLQRLEKATTYEATDMTLVLGSGGEALRYTGAP